MWLHPSVEFSWYCHLPQRSVCLFKWVNIWKAPWSMPGTQWMPAKCLMNHVTVASGLQIQQNRHGAFSDPSLFRKQSKTKTANIPKVSELTALIPRVSSLSTKLCSKTVLICLVREGLFFKAFLKCILLFNFCSFSLPEIRFKKCVKKELNTLNL